jgi:predicted transcriptional regulator
MMQRLTIRAEPELIQRVKRCAAQRGVSVSQFCREAMRRELGPDDAGLVEVNSGALADYSGAQ